MFDQKIGAVPTMLTGEEFDEEDMDSIIESLIDLPSHNSVITHLQSDTAERKETLGDDEEMEFHLATA
jgi:hypothetical protein